MVETVVAKILDWMGRSVKYMMWLCAASGLLLFLPSEWLAVLRVEQFVEDYGHWVGALFLISSAFVVIDLLHRLWNLIETCWQRCKTIRELKMLTPLESHLLMPFIESQKQTATFSLYGGEVFGLVSKGILYQAPSQANMAGQQDFNMYPWVYRYLLRHRDILNADFADTAEPNSADQSKQTSERHET